MKYKITIPKTGKNAGVATVEGMEQNDSCQQILQDVAVSIGRIDSVKEKSHFDDGDTPVFDNVQITE